jgi:hypothetical protein
MKTIHSETLSQANRLANRAVRTFPQATRKQVIAIRDEFISRLTDRVERKKAD